MCVVMSITNPFLQTVEISIHRPQKRPRVSVPLELVQVSDLGSATELETPECLTEWLDVEKIASL